MKRILISIMAVLTFTACHFNRKADKVFYNGKVYTMDNSFSIDQAFAIQNGRIKETGSNDDILSEFPDAEKIDLKGAFVYPGFIDAHCHFYGYATDQLKCDLYGTKSFEEIIEKLKEFSTGNKFSWLLGRGWDQNDWENKEYPVNELLDSLFPDIPVYLMRIDGHAALCNQKALDMAGITTSTKVDGGEVIQKDGKLTGLLSDNAVDLVKSKIPPFTPEQIDDAILKAQENCFAAGLTTLDDAGLGKDSIFILHKLQQDGKLKLRIYAMISDDPATLQYFFEHGPYKDERMNIRAVKVYGDGALGSRGACLKKEYSDQPGHFGYMLHPREYFDKIAELARNNGFQMCTHCIGDSANKVMIDVYSKHLSTENHRRWRIEHCQVIDPKDQKEMGDQMIIPSVQPTHATSDMYWAEERLGAERMTKAYAYEDIRDACDGMIVFGTDFPVEDISPLKTFYAAVDRKDMNGFPKKGFQPENKIKRKDALKAMTINAAYANFEEDEKGTIEEDKFADFVILDQDLLEVKDNDIMKTKVLATYVNGEKVFGK